VKHFYTAKDFEYNSHDMGEMGRFIRPKYAANVANAKLERVPEQGDNPILICCGCMKRMEQALGNSSNLMCPKCLTTVLLISEPIE